MSDLGSTGSHVPARLRALLRTMHSRRGSVSVMAAVMFPVLIAMAGLVTEYGNGLMARQKAQRMADVAALAGAIAYAPNSSTTAMNTAVARIAALNGFADTAVVAAVVASPITGDTNVAVQATVTSNVTLGLSTLIRSGSNLPISATSYSELKSANIACIIALSASGSGVSLSGGTAVTASSCAVASDANVTNVAGVIVPNGTSITTPNLIYASATPLATTTTSNIHAPSGGTLTVTSATTADPLKTNSVIGTAAAHAASLSSMASPSVPVVSGGGPVDLATWPITSFTQGGCNFVYSNGTWTATCPGSGPFTFAGLTIEGGTSAVFTSDSTAPTFNFGSQITNRGNTLTFPAGTYNLAQGIITSGGTTTTFNGGGTYNIGAPGSCDNGQYSISNSGSASLIFFGPSTFVIACGINNSSGNPGKLILGYGSSLNSYQIGYTTVSGTHKALSVTGGSITTFGDANGGLFQANGMLDMGNAGGACLTLPAASAHDINGSLPAAGGVILGAGVYSFNGYVALGDAYGGAVSCSGQTVGIVGSGVTLVVSAASTPSGACAGAAFCASAGYTNISLAAPTSGTTSGLVLIGPIPATTASTAGATFAGGASSASLSGVVYFPLGPISLNGGASVGNGTGQCLELIGSQVTLGGGTALASTCTGLGGQGTSQIVLVQ